MNIHTDHFGTLYNYKHWAYHTLHKASHTAARCLYGGKKSLESASKSVLSLALTLTMMILSGLGHCTLAADFNSLVDAILDNDPYVKASLEKYNAESRGLMTENQLEAPEVEVEHLWGTNIDGNKLTVSVSQSFDWPGVYASRKKEISAQNSVLRLMSQSEVIDRRLEIKLKLLEVIYLRQDYQLMKNVDSRIDSLYLLTKKAYDYGEVSILDLNRLKIERLQVKNQLASAATSFEQALSSLGQYGITDTETLLKELPQSLPMETVYSEDEYIAQLQNDPLLMARQMEIEAANYQSQTASRMALPGFSAGAIYNRELGESFAGFSVSVSLPFLKKNHRKAQARSSAIAASLDYQIEKVGASSQIMGQLSEVKNLLSLNSQYSEVFESADNLALLDMALNGGSISIMDYLLQVNYFYEAQRDALSTQYSCASAIARLNKLF